MGRSLSRITVFPGIGRIAIAAHALLLLCAACLDESETARAPDQTQTSLEDQNRTTAGSQKPIVPCITGGTQSDVYVVGTPQTLTNSTSAQFAFESPHLGSAFECRVDDGAFLPCISPWQANGLSEGSHTFNVHQEPRGAVPVGCEASYTWTVDLTPPTFRGIDSVAPGSTTELLVSWAVAKDNYSAADEIVYLICESPSSGPCQANFFTTYTTQPGVTTYRATPKEPCALYSYLIRAMDGAGNTDRNIEEQTLTAYCPWGTLTSGSTAEFHGMHFVDRDNGYIVGKDGKILKTADGGKTWATQTYKSPPMGTRADEDELLEDVTFLDFTTGYVVGLKGVILKTTDAGVTWIPRPSGDLSWYLSVDFPVDGNTGYVVGSYGAIFKTTDGAKTWKKQTSGTIENLWGCDFVDNTTGWVVGWNGTILSTADGGTTWLPQSSGTTKTLRDVQFLDKTTGWAAGDFGTVLSTADGGRNWAVQTLDPKLNHLSVQFVDKNTGYIAAGEIGTILKTKDAGRTWTKLTTGTRNYVTRAFFVDAGNGYVAGYNGTILKTVTGGE